MTGAICYSIYKIILISHLQAVCCADHVHCCPYGQKCNSRTGMCDKVSEYIPPMREIEDVKNTPYQGHMVNYQIIKNPEYL